MKMRSKNLSCQLSFVLTLALLAIALATPIDAFAQQKSTHQSAEHADQVLDLRPTRKPAPTLTPAPRPGTAAITLPETPKPIPTEPPRAERKKKAKPSGAKSVIKTKHEVARHPISNVK